MNWNRELREYQLTSLRVEETEVGTRKDLDFEALHRRYVIERDKRVRSEGVGQYKRVEADSEYAEDPYSEPIDRESVSKEVDVAIIGGGFSGLISASLLRKAGDAELVIIEDGGDFGGTWYWNRYPGARCDIESYLYMPMLEEVGTIPTERYASTTEIFEHAKKLGRHFDLYKDALFQTRITDATWDEALSRWVVRTSREDRILARFILLGSGQLLSRPKLPGIPGIESFKGHTFHTSRWDYDYTGGDTTGGLEGLKDKRVAVIGTGATAIQVVPQVARYAKQLNVVQRTPSIVDYRGNRPTDMEWAASLKPGWQDERMRNFDQLIEGRNPEVILTEDQWSQIWARPSFLHLPEDQRAAAAVEYDYLQMERIRAGVDEIVRDPATAESLKPYYSRFCKRPCFSDEYLQVFNQPNVTLVDTHGRGVDRVTETSLVVDGVEYEVDCIVFATGFETFAKTPSESGRYNIVGKKGISLDEKWGAGFRSLHGIATEGFPNMFVLGNSRQSVTSFNLPHRILRQAEHVIDVVDTLLKSGIAEMDVTPAAEKDWAEVIAKVHSRGDIEKQIRECTPGYYNDEGAKDGEIPVIAAGYGGGTEAFIAEVAAWRATKMTDDLLLRYETREEILAGQSNQ